MRAPYCDPRLGAALDRRSSLACYEKNVTGFANRLVAVRDPESRFINAASSPIYGDDPGLPRMDEVIGTHLSPFAVTEYANELYADLFARCYGMTSIGLRYFSAPRPRGRLRGSHTEVDRPVHRQRVRVSKR